jgi:glycerol-3-phosphate dehydrogenase (NAD(P)+)
MTTLVVLGAGMMGSALCVPMLDRGHEVFLVGTHLDRAIIQHLQDQRVHPGLPGTFPQALTPLQLEDLPSVMPRADAVALGVSSAGVRWASAQLAPFLRPGLPILSVTKGLDWDGQRLRVLPELLAEPWPDELKPTLHPSAVAGPCIAGELALRVETCVTLTGRDLPSLQAWADLLRTPYYFPQVSTDLVGAETCAALKNAFALAIGFVAGLHERRGGAPGSVAMHNAESALFAQASQELARVVAILGGDPASVWGLPGIGDLLVTCSGGRTSRLGRWLGLGLSRDEAVAKMQGATLESLDVLKVLGQVLPAWEARGQLAPHELPLLRHLVQIATDPDARVALPFDRFFQGSAQT